MSAPSFQKSLQHAWLGLCMAFRTERSFRVHVAVACCVVTSLAVLPLTLGERGLLLVVTMFVLVLELINSCVERLLDLLKPRLFAYVGEIKDLMAGAVLLASVFAAVIGALILGPHFLNTFTRL